MIEYKDPGKYIPINPKPDYIPSIFLEFPVWGFKLKSLWLFWQTSSSKLQVRIPGVANVTLKFGLPNMLEV